MTVLDLIPWLPLASLLGFIMTIPFMSEQLPDHPDLREARVKIRRD